MSKLFLFDIEGCLSLGKGKALSLQPLINIREKIVSDLNGNFALCTGRSQPFVEVFCQLLDLTMPCVCENGAYIYVPATSRVHLNPLINIEKIKNIKRLEMILESALKGKVRYQVEPGKDICLSLNPETMNDTAIDTLYIEVKNIVDLEEFNVTHSASAVDITPVGINKGSGVKFLSSFTNVELEDMVGVGDTAGDIAFLELVGKSAAPANAASIVKEKVNFVAKSDEAYGALEIINEFHTGLS